jgi:hypothetical protein
MYTNILIQNTIYITQDIPQRQHTSDITTGDIITLTNTVLRQNYLKYYNRCYKQCEEIIMGAPTSDVQSQVFLQHLE